MSQKISLKGVERKAFSASYQDGLIDIFIGCVVLMFAIAPFLSPALGDFWSSAIFLPFWGIVYLLLWALRNYVVRPRAGNVTYGSWRRSRLLKFNIFAFAGGILALILGILSLVKFDVLPGWIHTARFSLLMLVGFSVTAYFLEFTRLYLYGALIALSPLVGEYLYATFAVPHHGFPITFGLTAVFILFTGLLLFVRFLRDHPLQAYPREGQNNDV